MDYETYEKEFVQKFVLEYYDEADGTLKDCIETAKMIASHEWVADGRYEEYTNGLH